MIARYPSGITNPTNASASLQRAGAFAGAATIGASIGALVAVLGSGIISSPVAIVGTILFATAVGAWLGHISGGVVGAISGVLIVAFGSVVGGSVTGAVSTIVCCAALGLWIEYLRRSEPVRQRALSLSDFQRVGFDGISPTLGDRRFKDRVA